MADPSSTVSSALIGEIFVERGHITPAQLEEALATQADTGELLGEILVSRYNVPRVELAGVLAEQWATMERGGGVTPNEPMAEAAASFAAENANDSATQGEVDFERRPIGEIFVEQGVVTPGELESALATQAESGQRLGEVLVAQGVITRLELASALADQWSTLQKIRPPEPKPAAPWQEAAVRALPDGDAPLSPTPHRYESSADVEGLRDAVKALEERLRLVSATSSAAAEPVPDEALRELGETFERRLEELGQRFDETLASDISLVRTAMEELQARVASPSTDRVDELEQRLETAVDGLLARIESATNTGDDEAVESLRATLAGLEHRSAESPTRDELDALRVAFGAVSDDVRKLSETPSGISHDELEQHLGRVAAELGARIDTLAQIAPDSGALEEVRAQVSALGDRVAELPHTAEPSDLADRVNGLGSRLDEVAEAIAKASAESPTRDELDALRVAFGAVSDDVRKLSETPSGISHDELEQHLGRVAAELGARIDTLAQIAPDSGALEEVRAQVSALGDRVAELPHTAEPSDLADRVNGLGSRLDEVAEAIAKTNADTHALRGAIDADRESRDAVAGKLDETVLRLAAIDELRARVDALGDAPARVDAAVGEMDARLTLIAGTVAGLPTADRVAALEDSLASLPGPDRVAALEGAFAELAELRSRVDSIVATPAGVSGDDIAVLATRLDELGGRLDACATVAQINELEHAVDTVRSVETGQIDSLRTSVRELSEGLRELSSRQTGVSADELEHALSLLRLRLDELAAIQSSPLRGPDDITREQVDELVSNERTAREELASRLSELGNTVAGFAELHRRIDGLAQSAGMDEVARQGVTDLRAQLEGIGTRIGESAGHELAELKARVDQLADSDAEDAFGSRLAELQAQVEQVADRLDGAGLAADDLRQLRDRVEVLATDYGSRLHALEATQGRVDELDHRLDQLSTPDAETGQRLVALESLHGRIDALAASAGSDDVARQGVAELRTRLDALAELAAELGSDELARHDLAELTARVDQLGAAGGSSEDIAKLEAALARLEDALAAQRDDVEGRFGAIWGKVTELDEYRGRIDRLDAVQAEAVGRDEVNDVKNHLATLAGRLESVAPSDWVAGIERTAAEAAAALTLRLEALEELATGADSSHELAEARTALGALDTRIHQLAHSLEETRASVGAIDGNVAATLQAAVKDMVSAATVAELAEQVHARLAAVEASAAPTKAALDELGLRLGATEQRAWALPEELDDRFARLHQELMGRIDTLNTSQSSALAAVQARLDEVGGADEDRLATLESASLLASARLEGLEARLANADDTVAERVEVLESRFDKEAKRAEERGKATEKAIRKGLAGLADRLTGNEQAYVESGQALRRAIERLGAAVIEADTRIAEMPLDAPDGGYVAFVPTGDGYRLRPLEGVVPAVGDVLDLGEAGGQLRVTRIATSPLPLDRRACAYLERV